MSITDRTLSDVLAHKAAVDTVADARTRQLVAAWARAWDEIAADMDRTITLMMGEALGGAPRPSRAMRLRRQRRALTVASDRLADLCRQAGVDISEDARRLIGRAASDQRRLVATQLPPSITVDWARVDPAQMDAIVARTTEQITVRTFVLSQEATAAMGRELSRSVAVGTSPREAARRMLARVGDGFNGGLTRALVIARTEQVDAYRRAAEASQNANRDILSGWQWVATLGPRTCPSCLAHHGEKHPLDEPGPLDHHQGRCARVPVTKSWSELGFTGIREPGPSIRPGDGERWLGQQPEQTQRQVMGPRRFDAWQSGDYPVSSWSARVESPGWRPSYHVGPVRSLTDAS